MKKLKARHTYLLFALILSVFSITGCQGTGITGHWATTPIIPTVTLTAPVNAATGVAINTQVSATFSVVMDPLTVTTATFTLTTGGTAVPGTVTYTGVTAVFTPTANLATSTLYTATITTGAKNSVHTALASDYVWSFTTGATADITAPTVTATTHANGATGVALNAKAGATFSEAMDPLTITTATFTLTAGGTAVPGTVTYTGVNVIFTPTSNLAASTVYTVTITTGAKDLAGNAMAADYVWSWTTGATADTTAPTVTATTNANGATGVALNAKAGATFSEVMDPLTVTTATFTLTAGGTAVPGTVTYTGVNVVFTPTSNLTANTLYTATVTTGAKDLAGNALAADYVWSWTTGATADTAAPTVTLTVPANIATGVALNAKATTTFSEAMDPLTVTTVTYTLTTGGTAVPGTVLYAGVTAVFTPTGNLLANTLYTATIKTGATDLAGNALAADYVWSFTTGAAADTTAPTVTLTVPANIATGVAFNTQVSATFSEAMDPLTVTTVTYTLTTGGVPVLGTVLYAGVTAVFTPLVDLTASTLYTATVKTGAMDVAGNALAVDYVWSFTTGATPDTTPPTVTATVNANGAINVPINTAIDATFSEAMDPLTITAATFTFTTGGVPVPGVVNYSGLDAIFTPTTMPLLPNTLYTATVTTGAKDLAGNAMAANYTWSWTTGAIPDITAPTVTLTNPADLAVGVCINKTINATFSEAMDPLTITTNTYTLATTAGVSVVGVVVYDAVTHIATFNPTGNLTGAPATNYTATIISGVNGAKDLAGNALAVNKVTTFTTNASTCTLAPALGAAAPYGSFGGSASITNDGLNTVINGDLGSRVASTLITGFHDGGANVYTITPTNDGLVTGLVYTNTAPPGSPAGVAVTSAYNEALLAFDAISPANLPGGIDVSSLAECPSCGGAGEGADALAGRTLPPGVYLSTTGVYDIGKLTRVQKVLTLDAGGDANAVWVFQTTALTGTLTVGLTGPTTPGTPVQVLLINGAQPKNVFWYVPAGATIGTGATMVGTIMSNAAITFSTTGDGGNGQPVPNAVTTTLYGRAITLVSGVTMTNTVVWVPAP